MALHLHLPLHDVQVGHHGARQDSNQKNCSVVCTVVMIYCVVIIYIPSMNEGETNYVVRNNKYIFKNLPCELEIFIEGAPNAPTSLTLNHCCLFLWPFQHSQRQ